MKVQIKDTITFKPIEITLEKVEEAQVLWVMLSRSYNEDEKLVKKELPELNAEKLADVSNEMFRALDSKFTPKGHDDC